MIHSEHFRFRLAFAVAVGAIFFLGAWTTRAEGLRFLKAYNELARTLNERIEVVNGDPVPIKYIGDDITQRDLNLLRENVISLMESYYLEPEDLEQAIRYKKDDDGDFTYDDFGNKEIETPSLMEGVGNDNAFTMNPGHTDDEETLYCNDFENVPLFNVHFSELKTVIGKMEWVKHSAQWSGAKEKFGLYYESASSGGWDHWAQSSGCPKDTSIGWLSMNKWEEKFNAIKGYFADGVWIDAGGAPGWSVKWGYDDQHTWSTIHPKTMEIRHVKAYIKVNLKKDFEEGFFSFSTIQQENTDFFFSQPPFPEDYDDKEDIIGGGGLSAICENKVAFSEESVFQDESPEDMAPPYSPFIEGGQPGMDRFAFFYSALSKRAYNPKLVCRYAFFKPKFDVPGDGDFAADGLLATGCTCTSCKFSIDEAFNELGDCGEVKFPLGIGNGNIDGLKLLAYVTERNFPWCADQFYSLDTHVMNTCSGSLAGSSWSFVKIKRPSGAEVVFDLLNGEATNGQSYKISQTDDGAYEIEFESGSDTIIHKYKNGRIAQCRKITDDGELVTNLHDGVPQWNGLATYVTDDAVDTVISSAGMTLAEYGTSVLRKDDKGVSKSLGPGEDSEAYWLIDKIEYQNSLGDTIETFKRQSEDDFEEQTRKAFYQFFDEDGDKEYQLFAKWDFGEDEYELEIWQRDDDDDDPAVSSSVSSSWEGEFRSFTTTTTGENGQAFNVVNKYKTFPWGNELVANLQGGVGESSPFKETRYIYYDNPETDGVNYGKLKQVIYPDGSWERYEYDAKDRITKIARPFVNSPPDAPDDQCRVTLYFYDPLDQADSPLANDHRPRTVIEKILGVETSRSYTLYLPNECRRIRAAAPGAAWDDPANLVTISESYDAGDFKGRAKKITNPDGTITTYAYQLLGDHLITTVESGVGSTNVTDGTRTITEIDARGNTSTSTTIDIASGLTLSSADYQRDDFGRVTRVNYYDGTHTETVYGCCGPETQTNREGTTTTTAYDGLKRLDFSYTDGITTFYDYDVRGNVVRTTTKGRDEAEIATTNSYDEVGDLVATTDASGNVTRYEETFNEDGTRTSETIYPDGSNAIQTYARDGNLIETKGSAVHSVKYEYGVENGELFTKTYPADNPSQWTKTFTDFLGRSYKTVFADGSESVTFYDSAGRPVKQVEPGGRTTLTSYNAKGEVELTAIDANDNGVIDLAGPDRVTRYETTVTTYSAATVNQRITQTYPEDNDAPLVVNQSMASVDGFQSWNSSFGRTSHSQTTLDGAGQKTVIITNPDGSTVTQILLNGRLISSTHSVLGTTTYEYDQFNRLQSETRTIDGQPRTTNYEYDDNGRLTSVAQPTSGSASGQPLTTTHKYDALGRRIETVLPDGRSVHYQYAPTGELTKTFGADTYPVKYAYDSQGRMAALTTFKDFPSQPATTTWTYDPQRGFMTAKTYPDGNATQYAHNPDGSLAQRTWARSVDGSPLTTSYSYDSTGALTTVDHSDDTPDVAYARDRLGRPAAITQSTETDSQVTTLAYNDDGSLASASIPRMADLELTHAYDALGRRISTTLNHQATPVNQTAYAYDAMSRLSTVTRNAAALGGTTITTAYARVPGSSLLASTTLNDGTNDLLSTTRQYDALNRLTNISTSAQSVQSVDKSFTYTYNDNDQRVKCALADGSHWLYTYDDLGQVTFGKKFTSSGQEIPGQQFSYNFDDIGNRLTSTNSPQVDYTTNELNQYVSRTVPGEFTLSGKTESDASAVAIQNLNDGQAFRPERLENYFYVPQTVDNSDTSYLLDYKVTALDVDGTGQETYTTQNLDVYIPKNPEQFTYDEDGNMLENGRFRFTWDAENRLKSVRSTSLGLSDPSYATFSESDLPDSTIAQKGDVVALYDYDYQSRRVGKKVYKFHVTPGEPGTGTGEIPMITQIREKLAETIAKIEERRDKIIAHIQAKIEKIQNSNMPPRVKDKLVKRLEKQIEHETAKAERQIQHETEKAEQRIAQILEHSEEMIAKLQAQIEQVEEWRDRHVECIQAIIDWLNEHRDELEGGNGRKRGKWGKWGKKRDILKLWKRACNHGRGHWKKRWKHGKKCGDLPLFPHFIGFKCGRNWDIDKLIELLQQKITLINELADKRIAKLQAKIDALTGGGGTEPVEPVYEWRLTHRKFAYDGNNVIAVYDVESETDETTGETTTSDVLSQTMLWGEDLSGSLAGAGGVGGLLAVTLHSVDGEDNAVEKSYLPMYDGNGNVMGYVDAADGSEVVEFEYSPFGKLKVDTDSEGLFVFRFSTKMFDKETGKVHYRFRDYDPEMGRWLSRDPIGESGLRRASWFEFDEYIDEPLYVIARNDIINLLDYLGLEAGKVATESDKTKDPCACTVFLHVGHQWYFDKNWDSVIGQQLEAHKDDRTYKLGILTCSSGEYKKKINKRNRINPFTWHQGDVIIAEWKSKIVTRKQKKVRIYVKKRIWAEDMKKSKQEALAQRNKLCDDVLCKGKKVRLLLIFQNYKTGLVDEKFPLHFFWWEKSNTAMYVKDCAKGGQK